MRQSQYVNGWENPNSSNPNGSSESDLSECKNREPFHNEIKHFQLFKDSGDPLYYNEHEFEGDYEIAIARFYLTPSELGNGRDSPITKYFLLEKLRESGIADPLSVLDNLTDLGEIRVTSDDFIIRLPAFKYPRLRAVDPPKLKMVDFSPSTLYSVRDFLMPHWVENDGWVTGVVVSSYQAWVNDPTYLTFVEHNTQTNADRYFAVRASKRGNSVYARRVYARMKPLREALSKLEIDVDPLLQDWKSFEKSSKILMFSLTIDPKRFTKSEAWASIAYNWNRFLTALRKRYGRIEFIKTLESQKNGMPHIHGVLGFIEHEFGVVFHAGSQSVRLSSLAERDSIKELWPFGFSDIKCPKDKKEAVYYITKYMTKTCDASEDLSQSGILTRSISWFLRLRGFTVSRQFADLIRCLHNSNFKLHQKMSQADLFGNLTPILEYHLIKIASFYFESVVPPPDTIELSESQLRNLGFFEADPSRHSRGVC